MVDRNSTSPVATSPSALPTRSAIKSPLSAAKDALSKTHQIHPPSEPTPITVDLPESNFQQEAPNGHSDSIPPIEGEAEEAKSQSKESQILEEAEGRVNGTVNGRDSNNDSPTGDDPIQSDAASPKPPDSSTEPKPTDKAAEDLEVEPSSIAPASPPAASSESSQSQPEEVSPSDQDSRPSDPITAAPPNAEAAPVQDLTENIEAATDSAVTTPPANSESVEPDNKVPEGVADSRESEASGSSADINVAASVHQGEVNIIPEAEAQGISDAGETSATPPGVVDAQLEPTESSLPDPPAADDSSDAKEGADTDKDDEMDTSYSHGVDSLQASQFFPGSDMSMMPDSSALLAHQAGLGFDNVEDLSQATGPADPSTEDVSSMQDFMQPPSTTSNDLSLSVTDFINDPPDPPQMEVDPISSIPFPPTSTSTDPEPSSLPSLTTSNANISPSNPSQSLTNGPSVPQPQPSGPASASPVQSGLQPSPSWAPTTVSDNDGTVNSSATAAESTSSPTTSQAANPTTEVKPSVQAENASKNVTSAEQAAPSTNGTSGETSHGVSPNAASTAVNSDAGDHKPPSPALPKTAANAGGQSKGDPKAGLVLSLNEELIKICVAFSTIAPGAAEANEYQTRLSSNLGWLASVADTATQHLKPGSAVALPILQPPKPLPPSPLTSQCGDSLQKLPGLYARMQEAFKADYERKIRREAKMRARAAAGMGFNPGAGGGIGGPSASALPPPGAAVPVAGVKREHDGDVETGDRKRAAVGPGVPMERTMSAGGSPTRPSTVRAGSLALSSTQSPVLTGQSPITAGTPSGAGGMQMSSGMSTPRIPATGFVPPISMPHRHSPQNSISAPGSAFGQSAQASPVGIAHPQRQPSLPPTAQHSPTHPQAPINNQFGQPQHQQAQAALLAQNTGDAGLTLAPQRPPSVPQPTGNFPQPQPSFQTPGMNNRTQQQQAMPGMGMGGPGRPPMADDQRTQQIQMQIRQQMASQQGLTPMQLQQQQQAQAFGQIQTPQTQGTIQPNALNAGGPVNPAAGGGAAAPGGGAPMPNQPMNPAMVQATIQNLHNPNNPITQHLHRNVPNFAGLPLQVQVNQFHAVQMRLIQNQQQQQQQQHAMAANAGSGNMNGTQGMQQRPPSAAGPGGIPPGISGLRNMRQGTASPRIPSTVPPQGMVTPQRQISGQHSGMNPPSSTVPQLGMGTQGLTPQQRQMMMMQQQQSQLSRMQPPGAAGGQSPSPSHHQFGQGLPNMSPMNRQAAAQFGNQGGQQGQGGGAAAWSAATPAGYVSSPLNPGWSPQATGGPGGMSAPSPAGSGFHVAASPAHHSEAGATPRHSGATPQSGMGMGTGFGDSAAGGGGTDFGNGGIDPSALFNEWTTQ